MPTTVGPSAPIATTARILKRGGQHHTTLPECWTHAAATMDVQVNGRSTHVAVFRSVESLHGLRDPWSALAATRAGFLSWEWVFAWSLRFVRGDRRLFVIAIAEGTKVIGIAPWYIDTVRVGPISTRQISFLGFPELGSDYLDVLVHRGKERHVAGTLKSLLFGSFDSEWDALILRDILADSLFLARFIPELRHAGKHYAIEEGAFCPVVDLPATFDEYLTRVSAHARHAFRRDMRSLHASGQPDHVVLRGEAEVRQGLPAFRDLYLRRWGQSPERDDLFNALDTYLPMAAAAWDVQLSLLRVDDRVIAGLLHLTRNRTMYQYMMAVDRTFKRTISVGHLMCGLNIEHAIKEGFAEYDFLKSEEEYKFRFMTRGRRAVGLVVYNRNVRSIALWGARAARQGGKVLLR